MRKQNIPAAPVQTCKGRADRHRDHPTATVKFEARERIVDDGMLRAYLVRL